MREGLLAKKPLKRIRQWLAENAERDIYDLQEHYVDTFDRGRGHCLHLFEHVHGDSRERGQAMVDLSEMYAAKGLTINQAELPDYLPLFLEYCSLCDYHQAQALLSEISHILVSIGTRLEQRDNHYHIVFDCLQALAKTKVDQKIIDAAISFVQAEDTSLAALDKEWEEAAAFDGDPQQADCAGCRSVAEEMLPTERREQTVKIVGGVQ
ncbi:nitrate reductase molybdenum cofactor assembly chaperone [Exilibacterium tricleocarpae]|uniref:nitrate reductase molybdenum cofactor assembly chaperone n=1 Tax=Exilibacterium tricleocarpae TaxID=2591008 RepID=UPI0015D43D05|nr:nitrate reductase molybdenum cofactor assembly chaperone [Exilibacterium tricleocarpae]